MELIKNQCLFCYEKSSVLSNRDSNLYFRLINKNYFELNYVSDLEFKKIYLGQCICVICAFKIENINILINTINHNEENKKNISNNKCSWCLEHSDTLITNETTTRSFGSIINAFDKVTRHNIGVNNWKICIRCSAAITNWFNLRTVLIKLQKNGPSSLLDPKEVSNNLSRTRRISDSSDTSDTKSKSSDKKVSKMPKIRLKLTAKPKSATKKTQKRKIEIEKMVENKLKLLKTVEKEDLNLSSEILNDKKMLLSIPYIKIDLIGDDSNEIEVVEASTSREPTKPPKKILKTSLSDEKNSSELKNGDKNNEISPDTLKQQKKPRRLSLVKNSTPKQIGQSSKKGKRNTSKSTKSTKNVARQTKSDEIINLDDSVDDVFEPTSTPKEKYSCSICKKEFTTNCDKKLHELEHNISFSPIIRLTNHDFSKRNKSTIPKTIKLTENLIELQETSKNKEKNEDLTPRKRRTSLESLSSNEDFNETPKNKSKPARKARKIAKTHQEDEDSPTSSKDSLQVPGTKRYAQKEVKFDEDDDSFTKKRRTSLDSHDETSDNEFTQTKDERSTRNEAKKKKLEDTVVMDDSDDEVFKNTSRDSTPLNFDDIFNSLQNDNEQSAKDENLSVKKKSKKSVSFRLPDEEEEKCSEVICLSDDEEVSENKNTAQETPSEKFTDYQSDEIIQKRDSLGEDDDISTKKDNSPSKIVEENHETNEETPELDLSSSKKHKPSPKSKKGKRSKKSKIDQNLPSKERAKPSPKSKKISKSSSKAQTTDTHPDANSKEDHDDLSTEEIEETYPSNESPKSSPKSKKKATNKSEGTLEIDTNEDQGDSTDEVEEQILYPEERLKPSPKSKKIKSKNKKDTTEEEQEDSSQENEGTKEKEPHSPEPDKDPETLSLSDENCASNDPRGIASPLNITKTQSEAKQDEIRDDEDNLSIKEAETNYHKNPEHERSLDEDLDHEGSKEKNLDQERRKEKDVQEGSEEEDLELSSVKKTKPSPKSKKGKRSKRSDTDHQNNEEKQEQELSATKKYTPSPKSRKGKSSKSKNSSEGIKVDRDQKDKHKDDLDVSNKETKRPRPDPKSKKSKESPSKNRSILEPTTTTIEDQDGNEESEKGTEEDQGVSTRPKGTTNEDTSLDAESINQTTSNAEENIPHKSKETVDESFGIEDTEEPSENLTNNEEGSSDKEETSQVVHENTNSLEETRQRFERVDSIEEIPFIDSIIEETQLELEMETKSSNCHQNSEESHKDSDELQPDEDIIDETLCPEGSSNHKIERKGSNRSIFDVNEDDRAKNEDKGSEKCETSTIFEHLPSFREELNLSDDSFHIRFDTPTKNIKNGLNEAISSIFNEDISSKVEENGTVSNAIKNINGNSSNIQSLGVTNQPNEDQNQSNEEIEDISNDINKLSIVSPALSGIRKTKNKDYTAVEIFLEDIGA